MPTMKSLKYYSIWVLLGYLDLLAWYALAFIGLAVYSPLLLLPYLSSAWLRSRCTFRRLPLSRRLLLATSLAAGLVYAATSLIGDWYYSASCPVGCPQLTIQRQIDYSRKAAQWWPFLYDHRIASADKIGLLATITEGNEWKEAAKPELMKALEVDNTSAVLLYRLIQIDLSLGNDSEAQWAFNRFKRVDRKSPLIKLVEDKSGTIVTTSKYPPQFDHVSDDNHGRSK